MTPEELIKLYNRLVAIMVEGRYRPAYGRRGGFIGFGAKNLQRARDYLEWLTALNFVPRIYLVGCFAVHGWCYQPKWINLQADRYVEMYRSGEATRWYETVETDEKITGRVLVVEEAPRAKEILKNRYRHDGEEDLCRAEKWISGGYNAASKICQGCRLNGECSRDR